MQRSTESESLFVQNVQNSPETVERAKFLENLRSICAVLKRFCVRTMREDKEINVLGSQKLCARVQEARRRLIDLELEIHQREPVFIDDFARDRRDNLRHAVRITQPIVFLEEEANDFKASSLFDSLIADSRNSVPQVERDSITFYGYECYKQTTTTVPLSAGSILDSDSNQWGLAVQRIEIEANAEELELLFIRAQIALFNVFKRVGPYASISSLQPPTSLGQLVKQMILDWHTLPESMSEMDHLREAIGALNSVKIPASSTTKLMLVPDMKNK